MWALWVVLVGSAVLAGSGVISARRRAVAQALIGDLEAALDLLGVGYGDDRYSWVPVLVSRNVPWESSNEMVAIARQHNGAVEVRQGLGRHERHCRLPVEGWHRGSGWPSQVLMVYRRPRSKQPPEGPAAMFMSMRPEQLKMFPDVPKRGIVLGRERASELELRSLLVGVGLASWFEVTVSSGDTCVAAIGRGSDGPEAARLVVGQGDAFNVWGPGATFCGSISLNRSSFRRRIGHVRLETGPPVSA
ncbi:MAG: hypothetical protein GY926_14915, partial [bacterium]|nr:hypothetical protein [bacterium]